MTAKNLQHIVRLFWTRAIGELAAMFFDAVGTRMQVQVRLNYVCVEGKVH